MSTWLPASKINELAADPARQMQDVEIGEIDFSKPFVPEEYTQLYYTPVYDKLSARHRLRYNQLFGVRINEYIMMLEADLIERMLQPLSRHRRIAGDDELLVAINTMIEEEKHHYQVFLKLNRACLPEVYDNGQERYFSDLPLQTRLTFGIVGMIARHLAFPLWYLMAMEESSTALARDIARCSDHPLGALEPTFAKVHREHMKDEARHLQVDAHLIEACLLNEKGVRQALNAKLFKVMLAGITKPKASGSGIKVISRLVQELPELEPLQHEMTQAVLALSDNTAFQESLFNRRIMPLTFGLFDASSQLAGLEEHMVGYERQ